MDDATVRRKAEGVKGGWSAFTGADLSISAL